MEYQEHLIREGFKAKKYVVGDATVDGHTHVFYLRDDLPIATTSSPLNDTYDIAYHAHSIREGVGANTFVCDPAGTNYHTHTKFTFVEEV